MAEINQKQYNELLALAYWIADLNYIKERYGDQEPELNRCRDTIEKCIFPTLDELKVPFWIQNSVICWAEQWRNYASGHTIDLLKEKGVTVLEGGY